MVTAKVLKLKLCVARYRSLVTAKIVQIKLYVARYRSLVTAKIVQIKLYVAICIEAGWRVQSYNYSYNCGLW